MINIKDYYFASFVRDLDKVIGTNIPRFFGGSWKEQGCPELEAVTGEFRPAFVACLYFSVLIDQALCHHAHDVYTESRLFVLYPKFNPGPDPDKRNMPPRLILRFPLHCGLVSSEGLSLLAQSSADLFHRRIGRNRQEALAEGGSLDFLLSTRELARRQPCGTKGRAQVSR